MRTVAVIGLGTIGWGIISLTRALSLAVIVVVAVGVTLLLVSGVLWKGAREGGLFRLQWQGGTTRRTLRMGTKLRWW